MTLSGGGYLDNEAGATISSTGIAVLGTLAAPTIVNAGSILSPNPAGYAVDLEAGGFLSNTSSGYIGPAGIAFAIGGTLDNAGQIVDTGGDGVHFSSTAGTLTNSGTKISGQGGGNGVYLYEGSVTNTGTGLIDGSTSGVEVGAGGIGGAGTVTNSATIDGTAGDGVALNEGGSVLNTGTGLIEGPTGVYVTGAAGTVTNSAQIVGSSVGVDLAAGGTVINSGTISGTAPTNFAVKFAGSSTDFLVLESGYKFTGNVAGSGSAGATNTLELSGSLGAVTVNYNALTLTNFQDVLFDPPSGETLKVANTAGTLPVTISGFTLTSGQTIDLTGVANGTLANSGTAIADQLVVSNGVDTVTLQLDSSDRTVFNFTGGAAAPTSPRVSAAAH